jgi:hypothetical protein
MTDFYWPSDIIPSAQPWRIIDNAAAYTSPFNGATQTVGRAGGIRIACSITTQPLKGADRHRMLGLIAALRGRENRIWLPDFALMQRGSFPTGELLANTTFATTTGWTSSNAELALVADSGRLRLARGGVTADRTVSAPVTTVSGSQYLFRAGLLAGRGPLAYALRVGTTAGGTELVSGANLSADGLQHVVATASGTSSFAGILDRISGRSTGQFQFLDSPSFARCALVNGGSQSGSAILIDGLPVNTNGILVAGDIVAIYTNTWEMKRLRADLSSDGSGNGWLMFEPSLRVSPADNSPVAIWEPRARFMLASQEITFETAPGHITQFQLEFIEDIAP